MKNGRRVKVLGWGCVGVALRVIFGCWCKCDSRNCVHLV